MSESDLRSRGGQRTYFSWVFMVQIQVNLNSTSNSVEEDFIHRIAFSPLPPPLRFCRERLLPSLRSSSSLFGRLRKKKFGSRFWNFRFASDRSIYGSLALRSVNPHFLCSFSFSIYLVFVHSSTFHDKFGTTTAAFFGTRKIVTQKFLIHSYVYTSFVLELSSYFHPKEAYFTSTHFDNDSLSFWVLVSFFYFTA